MRESDLKLFLSLNQIEKPFAVIEGKTDAVIDYEYEENN